jgi:hypothetical protein
MTIKKYTDWFGYWIGLRENLLKCIGTTGTMWLGSNGVANIGLDALKNVGINWKQAVGLFAVHIGWEVFSYLQKTKLEVITETIETSSLSTDAGGGTVEGSSKTVTTTPVSQPTETKV